MKFMRRFMPDQSVLLVQRTPAEKVQLHIERYARAIEQAEVDVANGEKSPERLEQLQREARYWSLVQQAQQAGSEL